MSEGRFLSALKEAKDLFLEKLQTEEKLKNENGKLIEEIKQLKSENERLLLETKRLVENDKSQKESLEQATKEIEKLTEKVKNSKKFLKVYFKDQLNRMKEIEKNGIYNAETFAYLFGDVGRSLCNTSFGNDTNNNESNNNNTVLNKKPCQGKLSTNKGNRRTRYEDVEPSSYFRHPATTSSKDGKHTAVNTEKYQDRSSNRKRNEQLSKENKQTLDTTGKDFSTQEHLNNRKTASNKNSNVGSKNSKPQNSKSNQNFLDPDITLCLPIGPPFKSSTQIESKEKVNSTAHTGFSTEEISKNQMQESHLLDPDLTLRSPIGPPSRSSTPQGPTSGEEPEKFTLARSPERNSPSILSNVDSEGLRCTLLPQILSMEGQVPEQTQPQSPTILTRSHSFTRTSVSDNRTPKRKRNDESFGSLLASKQVDDSTVLSETRTKLAGEHGNRNQCSKFPVEISPDLIVLDDSDFTRPNSTSVPRKKPKTSVANESVANNSSLLFLSPQTGSSPALSSSKTLQSDSELNGLDGNEDVDQVLKIALNFNLDESTMDERTPERKDDKNPQYKYKEVVRGKDKRAKLNGYFCTDCEKYYGGLKLTEAEIQERLQACSRHRARFSPPPSTPEHFWQIDFMNTNEYIEKGFMRTEDELPPEKRKLKSRKLKAGRLQK